MLNRGDDQLTADEHFPVELRSDHDAVVAGFSWATDLPTDTTVVRSDPTGDAAARRAALKALLSAVRSAPTGAAVRLVTSRADLYALRSRLRAAALRGVDVRVSITSSALSPAERKLRSELAAAGPASWLRACTGGCAQQWLTSGAPRTLMMVGGGAGAWVARLDTGRALTRALVQRPTKLTVSSGRAALQQGDLLVRAVA